MPVITIAKTLLYKLLEKEYETEVFEDLCFDFGVELDDIVVNDDKTIDFKIEIPANRYDLISTEGFVRALRFFIGKEKEVFKYETVKPEKPIQMVVKSSVNEVRPIIVCAVLRGITFTQDNYNSFIELQEKLHQNICKKRSLVSIGTHDLDTIKAPFVYSAQDPSDIKFVPLNNTKLLNGHELMVELKKHEQLKHYLPLIQDKPKYPVIHDADGVVLSLPPIINGDISKIKLSTRNVFIEVTAVDETKARVVLDNICTTFGQYCDTKFQAEQVEILYEETGKVVVTPQYEYRTMTVGIDYLSSGIGVTIEKENVVDYLRKMQLTSKISDNSVDVLIPPNRSDIFHPCDILEDVAIGYGYNNVLKIAESPKTLCHGAENPLNKFSDKLRQALAFSGYTEVLSFSLCSVDENYGFLNLKEDGKSVVIANPSTVQFQIVRTSLYPGLLKTLYHSRKQPLPIRIFEVSDVSLVDDTTDVGARNKRCLCAMMLSTTGLFEDIHGLLDKVMVNCGIAKKSEAVGQVDSYYIKPLDHPTYLSQRCAEVVLKTREGQEVSLGVCGVINPDVLLNYEIVGLAVALHLDLEILLSLRLK